MIKKIVLTNVFLSLMLFSSVVWGGNPTHDVRSYKDEIKGAQQATEELKKEMDNMKTAVKSLTDVGSLVDGLLNFDFLMPSKKTDKKSKVTTDVTKPFTQKTSAGSGDVAGQAKAVASSITGSSGSDDENPFPDRAEMNKQVDAMQVKGESSSDSESSGSVVDTAKSVVSSASGQSEANSSTGQEIAGKRKKMPQTKQAWARYSLATALVNRSLAYRTVADTKKQTTEKVNNATNLRKAHTAKVHGYSAMAASYNRLLLSQAVANGLASLKAMDHVEGKISISNPLMEGMGGKMNDLKNFVQ